MTPNPLTGLVEVLDLGPTEETRKSDPSWRGAPVSIKMWPVDVRETFLRGGKLKDGTSPRFVLAESYVAPDPA